MLFSHFENAFSSLKHEPKQNITTQKLTKFGTHFHNDILHFCRECPGHLNLTFCSPSTHEGLFLVVPATFPGRQEHLTVCERSSIRFLLQHLWAAMTSHVPPSDKEKKIQKMYILMWININRHCHRLSNAGMSQSDLCPPPHPPPPLHSTPHLIHLYWASAVAPVHIFLGY